jgi:hypothetical protein
MLLFIKNRSIFYTQTLNLYTMHERREAITCKTAKLSDRTKETRHEFLFGKHLII